MPLIVLVWVVRRWLQIVAAHTGGGEGFFNGLLKADHRMDRCHLKGAQGDRLHAVLCAAGYNIRWLLRMIAKKGVPFLLQLYLRLCKVAVVSVNWLSLLRELAKSAFAEPLPRRVAF